MQTSVILLLVALATPAFCSSCSVSVYTPPLYYSLPASISEALDSAFSYYPDIFTIGNELSTIEMSTPTLSYDENVICSYIYSSPSIVYYIEEGDYYPSQVTDVSSFDDEESSYYTLATAIASLISIEATNPSLSADQYTLQQEEQSVPCILTDLEEYTDVEYPSIYSASQVIDQATLTSSSIVADVISVYTAVADYSTVSSAISDLSYTLYTLPSTVVSYVIDYISSPSTMAPSEVAILNSCYSTVYSEVTIVTSFTYSFPSVVSALTSYLYVASSVSSIGSAVYTVLTQEMPTFTYQESVIAYLSYSWPSVSTDLDYLSSIEVSSSTLGYALSYLEQTFYDSPAVAESLYNAIESPSSVTDTEEVSYEEMSHQSFVSALTEVISFETAYPSYYSTFYYIMPYLTCAWQTEGTLLTAGDYIEYILSSQTASADVSLDTLYSVVSSWETVLSAVGSAVYYSPSLSCDEDLIASYAYSYATVVSTLWSVITDVTQYTSQATYYASLEASYSQVVSALESVYSAAYSYPSLYSYESSFITLAESDSSALTQYYYYSSAASSDASSLWFYSTYTPSAVC
jgi:hypothetical protein